MDEPEITRQERPEGEKRSLTEVGQQFLDGAATGGGLAAGAHVVNETVGKIKDVLTPKDEAPKVELPPGVEKD